MADFDPFDLNDAYEYPDDEDIGSEDDLEPEPEHLPNPAEPRVPTDNELEFKAVRAVVDCLNSNNIKMDQFLDALCWGNRKCVGDSVIKEARRQLIQSKRLTTILDHMHTPINYTGERPKAAAATLNRWAWRHTTQLARHELHQMATDAATRADEETSNFLDHNYIKFDALKDRTSDLTPGLVRFLTLVSLPKSRAHAHLNQASTGVDDIEPSFAAKHLSLYFRAKHVPKSLYLLFHRCGYTLSYSWSNDAITKLSKEAMDRMTKAVEQHAVFWIYDNLRLPTPIKAQRGNRHTVTDNGTAMTVVELPDKAGNPDPIPPPLTSPANLSWNDFLDFDRFERLVAYDIYLIHSILFETVPGLADLEVHLSKELLGPVPLHTMPWGEEHKTRYYMLGTVPIDESKVSGNLQVIYEMARQTGLDSDANQKLLGTGGRNVPMVGNNMTASRIRTLQNLRTRDPNGYERLSWGIVVLAWFHILLNLGMSTFDGHRGSDQTMTFYKDLTLLGRSGLNMNMRQKRPDFFTNDEFL
ncbi:hypothetical protein FRC08_011475 [Ceratobasidium sp. 394]|nr:hypothetical protein FRC08_011475 [Ceratobasidium sp. 394]